jgi:hypothetical protein
MTSRFHEMKIPSFNKSDGNVSLWNSGNDLLDSYYYDEKDHIPFLDITKGVSLERIFPLSATINENFVSGVESTNFATPGYQNKNFKSNTQLDEMAFQLEKDLFSPNGDGLDDQLIFILQMPETGYLTTIRIYDTEGKEIKELVNNYLTGIEDIIKWDGLTNDGSKAAIGHYIVVFQSYNQEGNVLKAKKLFALLDFL